jgi:hypothetical protein
MSARGTARRGSPACAAHHGKQRNRSFRRPPWRRGAAVGSGRRRS